MPWQHCLLWLDQATPQEQAGQKQSNILVGHHAGLLRAMLQQVFSYFAT
jgi:hypothetical protein